MNRELERKVIQARQKRQRQEWKDWVVNTIEFTACTFALVACVFFGWLTLGALFR